MINIFNVSIYNQLLYNYQKSLNGLIKYNKIFERMEGYYTNDEIHYIVEVYMNQIIDIIHSKTFDLFVPKKVKNEILKYIPGIKSNYLQKYYNRIIDTFKKILNMISIKIDVVD